MTKAIDQALRMRSYAIYRRPADYPDHYVVREWVATGRGLVANPKALVCSTLTQARASIPPEFIRFGPMPGDDPVIVETWL